MKNISNFLKSIFNFFFPTSNNSQYSEINIPLTLEQRQIIMRLIEKSGVKDFNALFASAFSVFELQVDHELNGGTIDLVEPNGVNKEKLNLLRHLYKMDDDWKEE